MPLVKIIYRVRNFHSMNIADLHGRRKMICLLGRLEWWNLPIEEIDMLMPILSSPDIAEAKKPWKNIFAGQNKSEAL